jgi:predicted CoA-substrate-specific enzyme activase
MGLGDIGDISLKARNPVRLTTVCTVFVESDIMSYLAKGIKVGEAGDVKDFVMNDKCAAGTGRFLASAAEALALTLDTIGDISLKAKNPVRLTTVCTVFVESDIMSYLAQGKKTEDILGGVHSAIAARTISLVRRVGIEPEVTFTGGVSRNIGMVRALEEKLGMKLNVSPDSHFVGALGASLLALERAVKARAESRESSGVGAGPTA